MESYNPTLLLVMFTGPLLCLLFNISVWILTKQDVLESVLFVSNQGAVRTEDYLEWWWWNPGKTHPNSVSSFMLFVAACNQSLTSSTGLSVHFCWMSVQTNEPMTGDIKETGQHLALVLAFLGAVMMVRLLMVCSSDLPLNHWPELISAKCHNFVILFPIFHFCSESYPSHLIPLLCHYHFFYTLSCNDNNNLFCYF